MALAITDACTGCYGCQTVCPTGAVRPRPPRFTILAASCTECAGKYDQPQCAAICPVEGAIINSLGLPLNPPGSLAPQTPFDQTVRSGPWASS